MRIEEPEGQSVEFKEQWCDSAKKTLIAFANDLGGILYFGVADDGTVKGCDFDETERSVMQFARNGVEPPMNGLVHVEKKTLGGKAVALAFVMPGSGRPYGFKGKLLTKDGVFIRIGGQTVAATLEEVLQIVRRGNPRDWEGRACGREDLTFRFAAPLLEANGIAFGEVNWLGLGIYDSNRLFTNLAMLLSDQNDKRVSVNAFRSDGSLQSTRQVSGSILEQMLRLREILDEANAPSLDKNTGRQARETKYPWPRTALREALTNCLAHRDYSSPLQSAINISPENINFLTVGGLPPELTLEEAVLPGATFCRNQLLADIFRKLGWMEKVGCSFSDVFRSYAPYPQKPILKSIGRSLVLDLPRVEAGGGGTAEERLAGFLSDSAFGRKREEIENFLGLSRPTTLRLLRKLKLEGKVLTTGNARSLRYLAAKKE